ncbi:MAG TPA: hypothetical protein PLC24_12025, partial [Myxococcota bacterium]|nr:hypothetical protein [Myxococcota bacterium]
MPIDNGKNGKPMMPPPIPDSPSQPPRSREYMPVKVDSGAAMGEILLREKLVNVDQLHEAKQVQGDGENLGYTLARLGYLEESQLINFLSRQYGVPSINLDEVEVIDDVISLVPREVAERHCLMPIARQGSTIIVAMTDPGNIYAMDDLKFLTGLNVESVVASETAIKTAIERYYGESKAGADLDGIIREMQEEEDDVSLVDEADAVDVTDLTKA